MSNPKAGFSAKIVFAQARGLPSLTDWCLSEASLTFVLTAVRSLPFFLNFGPDLVDGILADLGMLPKPLDKNSEPALSAELSAILDAVVEGVCGVDAEGNATFCNDALAQMTGYRV